MKKRNSLIVMLLSLSMLLLIYFTGCDPKNSPDKEMKSEKNAHVDFSGFPDFGVMVSPATFDSFYSGKSVFKLRQDYPEAMPGKDQIADFFKLPFDDKNKWLDWMNAIRDYCFDGMIDVDFVAQKNKVHDWYHVPWLHWGFTASEGFHGLVKEININPYQISPTQTKMGQVYALAFYNNFAGHVLHNMWKDPNNPNSFATEGPDGGFPVGTVIFKLLFTDLDSTQADFLQNPFEWDAFISPSYFDSLRKDKIVHKVHLIQMDIMVRDSRADKYGTGWVFGTFCYNGKLNNGKAMKDRVKNLVPVGIQFGTDPGYKTNWVNAYPVSKTMINDTLKETFINPSSDLPPQHLGWGGRLDGIVDLTTASCMSCHSVGEFPQISPVVPAQCFIGDTNSHGGINHLTQTDSPQFIKYFQNLRCATAYDPKYATSTDFSLQVSMALDYFWQWKNRNLRGMYADEYNLVTHEISRGNGTIPKAKAKQK